MVGIYAKWGVNMIKTLWNIYIRRKTRNLTRIPIFTMTFNYSKYKKDGAKDSCMFYCLPDIANDEFVKEKLCEVVDYVRDNYDIEKITGVKL